MERPETPARRLAPEQHGESVTQAREPTELEDLVRGVDVSHHQAPGAINWKRLAETHRFVYVRATYGTGHDEKCAEHVKRARDVGLKIGLYHYYRPGQDVRAQLEAFNDQANLVGMCEGWLLPAIDVEQNPEFDGEVTPEKYAPAEEVARELIRRWGAVQLYTNPAMWVELGQPAWARDCSLWIAHYKTSAPKTPPSLEWTIWQHLVAPLPGVYEHDIDQDLAKSLPLIEAKKGPSLLSLEQDLEERRGDRDEYIKDLE